MKRSVLTLGYVLFLVGILMLACGFRSVEATPRTWIVDVNGSGDFTRIQDAVNAAAEGDTVYVKPGVYYENVDVSKNVSLVAESQDAIINGTTGSVGSVVLVTGIYVSVVGFTIRGDSSGIFLFGRKDSLIHTVISKNKIMDAKHGVYVYWSNGTIITDNTMVNDTNGVFSYWSVVNITRNTFENNICGINRTGDRGSIYTLNAFRNNTYGLYSDWAQATNKIYHNNFIDNTENARVYPGITNTWDDGYPSGGNYWSNHTRIDNYSGEFQSIAGGDGICDTMHTIDTSNLDRYPLAAPINTFDAETWNGTPRNVDVITNSTISNFYVNTTEGTTIGFNVTGLEGMQGFCRISIPNAIVWDLWQNDVSVFLNGEQWPFRNWTDPVNTYIYIGYQHSEHEIVIIPEFPSTRILLAIATLSALALIIAGKHRLEKR